MSVQQLAAVAGRMTPSSVVTVDRRAGDVFVDDQQVAHFPLDTFENKNAMEKYADNLWTFAEDLKAARAGWPV